MSAASAKAADWPTWRRDASRSGVTQEELPKELHLRWSRCLPAPKIAWPNEPRLQFDVANEPIVMGRLLFVGSSRDGGLRAFDTETGEVRWTFFTEGPIRFAPVAWKGRVSVGSDDGYLYCLDATTGKQLWKVRGAPAERADDRHLGNARLISYWPVRGGPVLHEGTIYFGAGIWASMGVFVKAVDAETGEEQSFIDKDQDATALVHGREQRHLIERALAELSESSRIVFILREMEDLSYEEIAASLGWKIGTVKSRLFRARRDLAKILGPSLEELR
jgi:RNA polymerase sigma factor (sigma-70 family)